MIFNGKSKIPKISLEDDSLELVKAYKYLGVWFDSKLDWKLHKRRSWRRREDERIP